MASSLLFSGAEVFVGDFDHGGVEDLSCWHRTTGTTEIDLGSG